MKIKDTVFDKNRLFFTSDTHFYHSNIIKYCTRPFDNKELMNAAIIENWNTKVKPGDTVFHLGDVSLGAKSADLEELIGNLNGQIYLIIGNHEKDALRKQAIKIMWKGIYDIAEIFVPDDEVTYEEQHIVMCHYPMTSWNGSHRGSWQLFGHVHGVPIAKKPTQLDVGVDSHDFTPISYQEVKEIITKQHLNQ